MSAPHNRRTGRERRQAPRGPDRRASEHGAVFRCPHCNAALGTTNGRELKIDEVIFTEVTKLRCIHCLQSYEWHPEPD